jgi:hypothetical protein
LNFTELGYSEEQIEKLQNPEIIATYIEHDGGITFTDIYGTEELQITGVTNNPKIQHDLVLDEDIDK